MIGGHGKGGHVNTKGTKDKKRNHIEAVKRELEELFDDFYQKSVKEPKSLKRLRKRLAELGVEAEYEISISYRSDKKRGTVEGVSVRPNHGDHRMLKDMGIRWTAKKPAGKRQGR